MPENTDQRQPRIAGGDRPQEIRAVGQQENRQYKQAAGGQCKARHLEAAEDGRKCVLLFDKYPVRREEDRYDQPHGDECQDHQNDLADDRIEHKDQRDGENYRQA